MRIIHVCMSKEYGEIENQIEEIIKNLDSDHNEQYLVTAQGVTFGNGLRSISLEKITVLNSFFGHGNFTDADVIHAHDPNALAWAYRHSKKHKIPFIATWRTLKAPKPNETRVLKHASLILAISRAVQKRLESLEINRVKIVPDPYLPIKPNAIEITHLRAEFNEAFVIGCICDINDKLHGLRYLIDAARELKREIPALAYVILGEGPDLETLQEETKDMENIHWISDTKKISEYLSIMNVFCYPTLYEPFGNTLLRTMQYQVPIIASQVGGIVDILQNRSSALLVPPRRPGLIADAIRTMYREVGIRNSIARDAYNRLKNFSPKRIGGMHEVVYKYIITSEQEKKQKS